MLSFKAAGSRLFTTTKKSPTNNVNRTFRRNKVNFTVGMEGRDLPREFQEFKNEINNAGTYYGFPENDNVVEVDLKAELESHYDADVDKYCRVPIPYDFKAHYFFRTQYEALKKIGIPPPKHEEAHEKYDVSIGSFTLEWLLPTPPPFHTFDELPIIKETPDYKFGLA